MEKPEEFEAPGNHELLDYYSVEELAENIAVLTRKDAILLGIVRCASCGYPPNSHFLEQAKQKCAHSNKCTGYKEMVSKGGIVKPPKETF